MCSVDQHPLTSGVEVDGVADTCGIRNGDTGTGVRDGCAGWDWTRKHSRQVLYS